jgi:TRAP-type transport system periplasmic protein
LSHAWKRTVEARTAGRVKVKFYAGGVQGDERDVLRKIRLGQLSGAAITNIGLSVIAPEVRALDAARTDEELDAARAALGDMLRRRFLEKGYVVLGWGDVGPVHLFSQKPIRSFEDLRAAKVWRWHDDPLSKKMFGALGIEGVPLGVPDMLPALATGNVNAFFSSPLAVVALQWGSHARYVSALTVGQATGATVIAKAAWDTISPADQQILLEESKAIEVKLLAQTRADNTKALASLRARGVAVVAAPPEFERELRKRGEQVAEEVAATFSPEFQAEIKRLLTERGALPLR